METTTLKQLLNKIESFANSHGQVRDFGVGSYYKVDTVAQRGYPLLWVTPQPSYIKGNSLQLTLHIMIADIIDGEESNLTDVWTDTLSIAVDLIAYFGTWDGYPDFNLRLDESSVYLEPFSHLLDNETAGYFVEATFIIPLSLNYCDNPTK